MKKINNILVPLDFSPHAIRAFRLAVRLAGPLDAEVHVLHALYEQRENIEEPGAPVNEARRAKIQIMREKLLELTEKLEADLAAAGERLPEITLHIRHGGAVAAIREQASCEGIDLIIMGTHGAHEKTEELFGTVASDVVGNVNCPVMVVPDMPVDKAIKKVAYALDEGDMDLEALRAALQLFHPLPGEVHLVHFVQQAENVREESMQAMRNLIATFMKDVSINIHYRKKSQLAEDLNSFVEEQGIDLLIMHRSRPGLFRKLFHRSLTRRMAGKARIPLLVV